MQHRRIVSIGLVCLGLGFGLGAATAQAQAPAAAAAPKFGVLSFLGESINIIGSRPSTGSRLSKNDQMSVDIPDAGFDASALSATQATLKRLAPQNEAMLFNVKAPKWIANPNELFTDGKLQVSAKLLESLRASGATHLVVLTRHRAEALVQFHDWGYNMGGTAEGLGYIISRMERVIDKTTGNTQDGFIAPFVFVRLSLVNLSDASVIKQRTITVAQPLTMKISSASTDPWDSLPAAEKIDKLNQMIERELDNALPKLVEGLI
ncbi:hypothetical protein [Roseateles sp.]|uniref:hypothetical protein n=1 Tax=Roseateles sp. TaxID=1971397 RepID=UPI00286C3B53|nr:hypothetical protein [Roseateles sp.]